MPALRIAIDLRGIDGARPAGPARYAHRLSEALRGAAAGPEVEVVDLAGPGAPAAPADVIVALGGAPRLTRDTPVVAAVYDLSHLLAPGSLPFTERVRRSATTAWRARQAAHLLAPSLSIAHGLTAYLRVGGDRFSWLPSVGPGWTRAPRPEVERERAELHLHRPYVLCAGALSRRKNPAMLLAAWSAVPAAERPALVLCGPGPAPALPEGARWLGYVPEARLRRLLSGATAVLIPGTAEGCSMPALEGMATGTPPIVTAGTAPAEVVGTAGIVVPAGDAEGWTAAIRHVCGNPSERNRMAARGLQAVRDLDARDAAARCLAAARSAARPRPAR